MGLEALTSSTYVAGLTAEWPTAGEPKSQGDDHIRLIKGVLKNTFPNASGPIYGPSISHPAAGSTTVLTVADGGKIMICDTGAGSSSVSLPAGAPAGWSVEIYKYTTDQNAVLVSSPTGVIYTQVGGVPTVRVGVTASIARFIWNGGGYFCSKSGPSIGSTEMFDGATIPAGYLTLDGSTFNNTLFWELYYALGSTTTLRDKRGRVDAGVDTGVNRLLNAMPGNLHNGGTGGLDYHYLTAGQIPSITVAGSASVSVDVTVYPSNDSGYRVPIAHDSTGGWTTRGPVGGGGVPYDFGANTTSTTNYMRGTTTAGGTSSGTSNNTSGSWHPNVQPTIITNKIVRAC